MEHEQSHAAGSVRSGLWTIGSGGESDWHVIDQSTVDMYANLTGDGRGEWIHLNPEFAARNRPFGGTIVPGFLQVAHLTEIAGEAMRNLPDFDVNHSLNYGFDKLRFPNPMPVGSRYRARSILAEVTEREAGVVAHYDVTFELDSGPTTLAARWLFFVSAR